MQGPDAGNNGGDVPHLRDFFAALAMHGVLAARADSPLTRREVARIAYNMADAMLEMRKEAPDAHPVHN